MTAARTTSDSNKALGPGEDKTSAGATAPPVLDPAPSREALRASDAESQADDGKIRVQYVHHVGDKKPGNHAKLPADEATGLIAARVAVLAED